MIKLFKGKNKEETDKTFFKRLRQGLSKTRAGLTDRLDQLLLGKKEIDAFLLEDLEEILFTSDLGVATTQELIQQIQERVTRKELDNPERLKEALKDQILSFLQGPPTKGKRPNPGEPLIIMVVGVNGQLPLPGRVYPHASGSGNAETKNAGRRFRALRVF